MVQAWYMNEEIEDKHAANHRNPPVYISLEDLFKKTGVKYYKMNVSTYESDGSLDAFRPTSFTFDDEITCSRAAGHHMLQQFWIEHLHTDDEIRLVLEGSGYLDVRDIHGQWVRMQVVAGDLVVVPSGCYHRFALDSNHYVKVRRFHIGEPTWISYNRPSADDMQ